MTGSGEQGVAVIESRRLAGTLMVVYAIVVAFIVFAPSAEVPSWSVVVIWRALQAIGAPDWISPNVVEFGTNVLLFVPMSFLGSTFRPRWGLGAWLLVGLLATACIEVGQALFLPGRSPQVDDMVANTLGAVIGYLLVLAARRAGGRAGMR